jgi:transcriptional regulator with XRE-family HTH domain
MEQPMLGDTIKALREAKSWSQAHLADAAQLNIRTVQRIEAGEPSSQETLLSLAAALDVDVRELSADGRPKRMRSSSTWKTVLAALCAAPAVIFVSVNLLRSAAGLSAPYDVLSALGASVMSFDTFNAISPPIFLGGLAAALALSINALIRLQGRIDDGVATLRGVDFAFRPIPLAILGVTAASLIFLVGYTAVEQLRTPLS